MNHQVTIYNHYVSWSVRTHLRFHNHAQVFVCEHTQQQALQDQWTHMLCLVTSVHLIGLSSADSVVYNQSVKHYITQYRVHILKKHSKLLLNSMPTPTVNQQLK